MPVVKSEPLIDNLKLRDFFKDDVYSVPTFQREYAWGKTEAKDLISDLFDWVSDDEPIPYYLMGQVVVVEDDEDGILQIVDGQQRITTLFLTLLAIDRRLSETGFVASGVKASLLRSQLTSSLITEVVEGRPFSRLILNGANKSGTSNQDFLESLLTNDQLDEVASSATQSNLVANFNTIVRELTDKISDSEKLFAFLERIMAGVYISRLQVESIPQALDIFEKLNNRGLNLSSADLLKNLLFQKSTEEEYDGLSQTWAVASRRIFQIRPKRASTMEFLVKAMIASETGRSIPTAKVYREWSQLFKDSPESFAKFKTDLKAKAEALYQFSERKSVGGENLNALFGISFFGTVQHFTVLLAGSHLNHEAFMELVRLVENRTVLSLIARERSQDFERMLPEWAQSINELHQNSNRDDVFSASESGMKNLESLLDRAKSEVENLRYNNPTDSDQIRYILTRISVRIETLAKHNTNLLWERGLLIRVNGEKPGKPFDLEHVFPQSGGQSSNADYPEWGHSIGNLALMHYSDNRAAGDAAPSMKAPHYASSELLLTKSLCKFDDLGALNPRLSKILNKLSATHSWNLDNWNESSAAGRTLLYWELFSDELVEIFRMERV